MKNNTGHSSEEVAPGVYTLACGNADAHLIVTPNGTTGLIDADRNQVVEELNELFGRTGDETTEVSIDFLHTTHIHQDHVFGIQKLKDAGYAIGEAYRPPSMRAELDVDDGVKTTVLDNYHTALSAHGIEPDDIQEVTVGDTILREGDISLTALSPPATSEPVEFDHPVTGESCEYGCELANPNSAACRYDGPHNSYLFMGDIENKSGYDADAWLVTQHQDNEITLDADVLVVGHHGAKNTTSRLLVETVAPEWTMLSADSVYHPATETLRTLQAATDGGVSVTGTHGRTAFTDGLPPTPATPDAPTEPWRIDRDKHAAPWSEIAGQERTKNETLEAKNDQLNEKNDQLNDEKETVRAKYKQLEAKYEDLTAQPDTSPTISDRIRSLIPLFGKRTESSPIGGTAGTDPSHPTTEETQTETGDETTATTNPTDNTDVTREEAFHALGLQTPDELQQARTDAPQDSQNVTETTDQPAEDIDKQPDEEPHGDSSAGTV